MSTDQEREAFEHYFSDGGRHPRSVERGADGKYLLGSAHNAWRVWQARAALATAGEPVDLSAWEKSRFGVFLPDGRFEELPPDDPLGEKHPQGHTARWVGGQSDMQVLRAALKAPPSPDRAEVLLPALEGPKP